MNLSIQKKIAPPTRLATTVAPRPAPKFLTTSQSIGVLNCQRIKYRINFLKVTIFFKLLPHRLVCAYAGTSHHCLWRFLPRGACAPMALLTAFVAVTPSRFTESRLAGKAWGRSPHTPLVLILRGGYYILSFDSPAIARSLRMFRRAI